MREAARDQLVGDLFGVLAGRNEIGLLHAIGVQEVGRRPARVGHAAHVVLDGTRGRFESLAGAGVLVGQRGTERALLREVRELVRDGRARLAL